MLKFKRAHTFTIGFIVCALLIGGTTYAAVELNVVPNPFPVFINGIETPVEGYNINGFTYLKLGDFKAAGVVVKFNETDKVIEITNGVQTQEVNAVSETTTPYRNPIMVDISTPPETIDGLSVYTVDGVQYVAARTKKDTKGNDVVGFDSKYFENNSKYFLMLAGGKYSLRTHNPETEILSIPVDKQYVIGANSVLCVEYSYYKNTVEPLIKPVEEPTGEAE